MSMSQKADVAACRVTGATGVMTGSCNIASCVRASAGVYTVVTNQAFDTSSVIRLNALGAASSSNIQDTPNADGVTHAITAFVGTAATDTNFSFEIERIIT